MKTWRSLPLCYSRDGPFDTYVDVTGIPELTAVSSSPLNVGGGVPLGDLIRKLEQMAADEPEDYAYGVQMAKHLKKVSGPVNMRERRLEQIWHKSQTPQESQWGE